MSLFKDVTVVSYCVKDWERAKKFYAAVLGWPVAYADENLGWVEYGYENQAHVAISRWRDSAPLPLGIGAMALLTVDDPHAVTKALRSLGVKCDDVVSIPGAVTYGVFYDPDGNRIQFASRQPPAA